MKILWPLENGTVAELKVVKKAQPISRTLSREAKHLRYRASRVMTLAGFGGIK